MPPDLSHHINAKSRARHPSPLKDIIKFMGQNDVISLAGGLPHPSLFPVQQASFICNAPPTSLAPNTELDDTRLTDLMIGRGSDPGHLELTQFLQYGSGQGNAKLIQWCKTLTDKLHAPPAPYDCILHPGNTNAWAKVVGLLCEDNDFVIVEEYTYPSAQAYTISLGIKAVPTPADAEGIAARALEDVLANWNEEERGARRPRLLYFVSVGSNPTGITISADRRREIYKICKKFDIIIVEDDPYYFLQYPQYQPDTTATTEMKPPAQFLKELTPSFLSMDTEGRVIRLDFFSKTIFPGLRLGYFIANPVSIERLLRATEVETQDPAGLSQAFVTGLLDQWGVDGSYNWLQHLKTQYEIRRNWLLEAFYANFVVLPVAESPLPDAQGLVVCLPKQDDSGGLRPVFSFVDPSAGMFVWSKFYLGGVQRFAELERQADVQDPEQAFAHELWMEMVEASVLLTSGSYYHPWQGEEKLSTQARDAELGVATFQFSFATPTVSPMNACFQVDWRLSATAASQESQIHEGTSRLRKVLVKHWV